MAPPRKPADRRIRRGTRDVGEVARLPTSAAHIPPPPHPGGGAKLLASTVEAWEAFWTDEVAGLVKPADRPALARLFGMYDERERMARAFRKQRMTTGSTGQLVVNPAAREMAALDARIEKLEARFGITPKARLDLGMALGAAAKSLDEINRSFDDDDDRDEGDELDPRLGAIDTTAS